MAQAKDQKPNPKPANPASDDVDRVSVSLSSHPEFRTWFENARADLEKRAPVLSGSISTSQILGHIMYLGNEQLKAQAAAAETKK